MRPPPEYTPRAAGVVALVERAVFAVRWLLVPLYAGLVGSLCMYILHFMHEVLDMFWHVYSNTAQQDVLMLFILELVDMTMISQLVVMTIQGGYAIFIRPLNLTGVTPPQWIRHGLGTSEQKIKLGMSITGIMIVQLLKNFIGVAQAHALTADQLHARVLMLGCVLTATLMFCVYNVLMHLPMLTKHTAPHEEDH